MSVASVKMRIEIQRTFRAIVKPFRMKRVSIRWQKQRQKMRNNNNSQNL